MKDERDVGCDCKDSHSIKSRAIKTWCWVLFYALVVVAEIVFIYTYFS